MYPNEDSCMSLEMSELTPMSVCERNHSTTPISNASTEFEVESQWGNRFLLKSMFKQSRNHEAYDHDFMCACVKKSSADANKTQARDLARTATTIS